MAEPADELAGLLDRLKNGDDQALATLFEQGRDRLRPRKESCALGW